MSLVRTVDAASEPVSLADLKAQCRVTSSAEDDVLNACIVAARQMAELELRRAILPQTWVETLDQFPAAIVLPYPPIIAVSSIEYVDGAGTLQLLDPSCYTVDTQSEPGWIVPAYGYDWPETRDAINAVTVTYTAGWADASAVPQVIRSWIKLTAAHLFENREATVQGVAITPLPFADRLLDVYRVRTI